MKKKTLILVLILILIFVAGCPREEYQVSLESNPQEGGQVSGAGSYSPESKVTVEAEPAEGYVFVRWEENGETVSMEKSYEFTVKEDRNLVAVFQVETVTVDLYFGWLEAIEKGEPGEYGYVTPITREIADPQDPEALLRSTLEELIKGPAPGEEGVSPVVHDSLKILQVEIEDGLATIDVCEEMFGEDWSGGTLKGIVFVQSMLHTAAQFPEVEEVLVLVEGEYWDDGHLIWDQPLSSVAPSPAEYL